MDKAWLEFAKFGFIVGVLLALQSFFSSAPGTPFNLVAIALSGIELAVAFAVLGWVYKSNFQSWSACLPAWFSLGLLSFALFTFGAFLGALLLSAIDVQIIASIPIQGAVWNLLFFIISPFVYAAVLSFAYHAMKKKTPVELNY